MNDDSVEARDVVAISNVHAPDLSNRGERLLALDYAGPGARARRPRRHRRLRAIGSRQRSTFEGPGYNLLASPQLYPGQTIRARVLADGNAMQAPSMSALYVAALQPRRRAWTSWKARFASLSAGDTAELEWQVPDLEGYPIAKVGHSNQRDGGASGRVYLDWLTWDGAPNVRLKRPHTRDFTRWDRKLSGMMWKRLGKWLWTRPRARWSSSTSIPKPIA